MKAWTLARKDLRIYTRDRAGMLLGLGLPIVLATVFGAAMGSMGGGDSIGRVELVVEDRDRSAASRALVEALGRSKGLRLDVLDPAASDDSARERVAAGDAPAGLLIGAGYGAALEQSGAPPLTLFRDPGQTIEQQIVAGNLLPALFRAAGDSVGRRAARSVLELADFPEALRPSAEAILDESWERMAALVAEDGQENGAGRADAGGTAPDSTSEPEPAPPEGEGDGPSFDFATGIADVLGLEVEDVVGGDDAAEAMKRGQQAHAISGVAVMMVLFGLVACGGTLLEEKDGGTLERLQLAPGAARAILGGKFLFTWIIGLAQLVILFLYARVIFDVAVFRAPLALLVHSAAVAAAATGFGLLFAVVCRTQKQLEGLSTIVILTMSAAGGSWWPLAITPEWYQFLGHFTLTAWAMDGYQAIFWYGQDLRHIGLELAVLGGIALVTSLAAVQLWNRRVRV